MLSQIDAIPGAAGWAGTGLLGAVLAWLCFIHLPAKDKQIKEMLEKHAAERAEVRQDVKQALEKICRYNRDKSE